MKTYEHVYDILSKSPDFVTGESLAKSLGVSRTAIWKAIQTLQEQGIDITSVRKKGYYLEKGDILLHGHTHVPACRETEGYIYLNPGSVSIPKEDSWHGYMTLENGEFAWKDLDGKVKRQFMPKAD